MPRALLRPISKQRCRRRKGPRWSVRRALPQAIGSLIHPDLSCGAVPLPEDLTPRRLSSPCYGGLRVRIPLAPPVSLMRTAVIGSGFGSSGVSPLTGDRGTTTIDGLNAVDSRSGEGADRKNRKGTCSAGTTRHPLYIVASAGVERCTSNRESTTRLVSATARCWGIVARLTGEHLASFCWRQERRL
jgi:hypothetical protein